VFLNIQNVELKIKTKTLLKRQNFKLEKGKNLLIIGPSGSGKTTLLNIMAGLLKPSSGEVIFQEKKYSMLSESEIDSLRAKNFGFIFQKIHLLKHLNIEQNILLATDSKSSKDLKELTSKLEISDKLNEKAMNLSMGEAQRVAIARGLANKPEIVFADEPTSSLDDDNTRNFLDLIFSLTNANDSSLVVCTHDKRIIKKFDNILELTL
tara:strand:- start:4571 stop:5194 length:624 start_codon:yes stop_codon:yes gene_type:complete